MIIQYFREVSHILDVNIFAYDYTGYGMSTGTPSEEALYADIEAAFKYLRDIVGIPWSEIVLYGRSIGSGPSIHLATRTAVRAMVLQRQVKCPVYIVHGTSDEIISYSHAEDLIRNCQEGIAYPPYMVENGGHNNLEVVARQPFYENFTKFLQWLEKSDIADELTLVHAKDQCSPQRD
ncbi:unnamed protein product [Durusdinium trenchii]|uniref:Serine aminopeptidase S33 domain-containing protein n=1 Tax=Durusdinium trenchii TaxID=1381693 RepID=A0ABP0N8C0_9DINO